MTASNIERRNRTHAAIMAAVAARRIPPDAAVIWAGRAARGDDVSSLLSILAPAPAVVSDAWPVASPSLALRVHDALAASYSAGPAQTGSGTGPITDQEADQLWPASTAAEAARRRHVQAMAAHPAEMSTEQLHAALFGDTTGRNTTGPD
jgi:hypothetical protein